MYELGRSITFGVSSPQALATAVSLETWHQRFVHCDTDLILEMEKKMMVDGLKLTRRTVKGDCIDCTLGRQKRKPFTRPIAPPELGAGDLVCIDLFGPAPTRSNGGAYYMMILVD
ncbi:hypothetical protein C8J56DRAFT_769159, partial [Mycena floridula]